ncbi:MAG: hypothetical protein JKX73_02360 [Flavobacteriales bacterium]|nr:hypothetical protein [Flavobacteriales bacterium]
METYKVYIFGIVALALALATLSFQLLTKGEKKKIAEVKFLTHIYIFVFFFMIILMLMIMVEFYRGPQIALTNNSNYQVIISERLDKVPVSDVNAEDANIYVDPDNNFYLSAPSSKSWAEPNVRNGLRAYLENAGLETGRTNVESFIKWNPYRGILSCVLNDITVKPYDDMMSCLQETLLKSTYGMMLKLSTSTLYEYGDYITVQISPDFKTPLTSLLPLQDSEILDSLNSTMSDSNDAPKYVDLSFINYFSITVLDKTMIPVDQDKITLANYFLKNTVNLSSNAEKIISTEKMMLFTSSFDFENARIGEVTKDFQIHRWVRMIEEPDKLFIIEMAYCPETDADRKIWKDQKLMFESFTLLSE